MPNIDLEIHEEVSTSSSWSAKEELLLPYPGHETSEDCYEQEDTEIIQRQLEQHGFHVTVDGKYGDKTKQAVYDFQTQKGIVNDGIVGPNTWSALFWWKV